MKLLIAALVGLSLLIASTFLDPVSRQQRTITFEADDFTKYDKLVQPYRKPFVSKPFELREGEIVSSDLWAEYIDPNSSTIHGGPYPIDALIFRSDDNISTMNWSWIYDKYRVTESGSYVILVEYAYPWGDDYLMVTRGTITVTTYPYSPFVMPLATAGVAILATALSILYWRRRERKREMKEKEIEDLLAGLKERGGE